MNLDIRSLLESEYQMVIDLDKKICPNQTITPDIMKTWNPEFALVFENIGICIAIPLKSKYWNQLIHGQLSESDLSKEEYFYTTESEIGIHIYHIEKFTDYPKFGALAIQTLKNLVPSNVKILGISGYVVTEAGKRLFKHGEEVSPNMYVLRDS